MSQSLSFPKLVEGAVIAELPDGEVMVATRDSSRALLLNETGSIVVSMCNGTISIDDMAGLFSETLGVDSKLAETDIRAVVLDLKKEGLLCPPDTNDELDP